MALRENLPHHANLTPEEMRQGVKRLELRIADVEVFQSNLTTAEIEQVRGRVISTLAKVFGDDTIEYKQYALAAVQCREQLAFSHQLLDPLAALIRYRSGLLTVLRDALAILTEELDVVTDSQSPPTRAERRYGKTLPKTDPVSSAVPGGRVFIVHGQDDAALHEVARFIEQLGLEPVILREQPGRGRTIIEQFEDCAGKVGFAVVLMTPDDIARPAATPSSATQARQNVIFELGYFAGKLGRDRACVLRKGEVEIPSDLYGVLYINLDDHGGWKLELARELDAAELKINKDAILR